MDEFNMYNFFDLIQGGDGVCLDCGHEGSDASPTGWVDALAKDCKCPECGSNSMVGLERGLIEGSWLPPGV